MVRASVLADTRFGSAQPIAQHSCATRPDANRLRSAFMLGCSMFMGAPVWSADVWVFTDHAHPVQVGPGMRVIELDAPVHIQAELTADLPKNPEQAAAVIRDRLKQDPGGLHQRLAAAYQGLTDAWSLGIAKIPAVVVDRRFVIYGLADATQAVQRIEQYRKTHS